MKNRTSLRLAILSAVACGLLMAASAVGSTLGAFGRVPMTVAPKTVAAHASVAPVTAPAVNHTPAPVTVNPCGGN